MSATSTLIFQRDPGEHQGAHILTFDRSTSSRLWERPASSLPMECVRLLAAWPVRARRVRMRHAAPWNRDIEGGGIDECHFQVGRLTVRPSSFSWIASTVRPQRFCYPSRTVHFNEKPLVTAVRTDVLGCLFAGLKLNRRGQCARFAGLAVRATRSHKESSKHAQARECRTYTECSHT